MKPMKTADGATALPSLFYCVNNKFNKLTIPSSDDANISSLSVASALPQQQPLLVIAFMIIIVNYYNFS